jgi:hypothetical protein
MLLNAMPLKESRYLKKSWKLSKRQPMPRPMLLNIMKILKMTWSTTLIKKWQE